MVFCFRGYEVGLWFLVIPILIVIFLLLNYRYEEINIVKHTAISITIFWILFSVLAGIYFMFDAFGFATVLVTELAIVSIVLISLIGLKGWKAIKVSFEKERDLVILLLLCVAFVMTVNKFELYDTGQDQGLYQIEALELYMGNYEVQHDFEEYHILEDAADKEAYYRMLDEVWVGYYPLSAGEYTDPDAAISEVSGMYHGVQTFPAMLALAGRLFGMEHMMQLQTILYLCSIALLYYTMCDMNVSKMKRTLLTMVFMLSPLALWISKATYTEMFLCLMIAFYCYLLFEENDQKWMMGMPLVGFSFVHVSFLAIWPIFWLANAVLYIYKMNRQYIWANILGAIGLAAGYVMMGTIAPEYFYFNCRRLYIENIITSNNLLIWIVAIAMASCVVSAVMLKIKMAHIKKIWMRLQKADWIIPAIIGIAMIYWVVYGAKMGFCMVPSDGNRPGLVSYYGQGLIAYTHLVIYACALATGFFIIPCVLGYMLVKGKNVVAHVKTYVLTMLFIYIVVLQTVFFRNEIYYYYYSSRYLLYYIPVICLMAAVCFQRWNQKVVISILLLSICCTLYFDVAIIQNKDDTKMEWEILVDLEQCVDENAAIIINGEGMQSQLGPQLRSVSGAAVFPKFENFKGQVQLLYECYDAVYILSEDDFVSNELDERILRIVYRDYYQQSMAPMYEWGIYPTEIVPVTKEVVLYKVVFYELGEDIFFATDNRNADEYVTQGLSHNEQTFAWIVGEQLDMQFWLDEELVGTTLEANFDVMYVYNAPQEVQIFVNDEFVDSVIVNKEGLLTFEFEVPQEAVNIQLLFPNAVSPKELDESADAREMSLGISKVVFVEVIYDNID